MKFPTSPDAINYKRLRLATGLSATEMAAALEVTRETICRREAGTMRITKEAALAMAYVCEEVQQVIWSFQAAERGEDQHDEGQADEAQTDEAKKAEPQSIPHFLARSMDDESRNDQTSAEHSQAEAPKKRKIKRWK